MPPQGVIKVLLRAAAASSLDQQLVRERDAMADAVAARASDQTCCLPRYVSSGAAPLDPVWKRKILKSRLFEVFAEQLK